MSSFTNCAAFPEAFAPDDEAEPEPEEPEPDEPVPPDPELPDPELAPEPDEPEPDPELPDPAFEEPDDVVLVEELEEELEDVCEPRVAAHPALNSAAVASTASRINLESLFTTAFPVISCSRSLPTVPCAAGKPEYYSDCQGCATWKLLRVRPYFGQLKNCTSGQASVWLSQCLIAVRFVRDGPRCYTRTRWLDNAWGSTSSMIQVGSREFWPHFRAEIMTRGLK